MKKSLFTIVALIAFYGSAERSVWASAPPRIVRAATSSNGQFLVISTFELGPEGQGGGRPILSITFEVSGREPEINSRHRLTAPNTYYVYSGWRVVLHPGMPGFNAWPLLSDDGKTLVLLEVTAPMGNQPLLIVYRQQDQAGKLLRSYTEDNLWPLKPGETEG